MRVDQFDFELPDDRIALRPANPRERARLLVLNNGVISDRTVGDLPSCLRPGDLLILNDTRVFPARLRAERRRDDGIVAVEVLLHRPAADMVWTAFARPGKRLRLGDRLFFADDLQAEVIGKGEEGLVSLHFESDPLPVAEVHGEIPLPPYISSKRPHDQQDRDDYQTVYADRTGSVAAPTAGLHFSSTLLEALAARGVGAVHVTLHVGAGTFQPVKVEDTADHQMHAEWGDLGSDAAARIAAVRAAGGRIIPVGTTALRLLESAAAPDGLVRPFRGETDIFITPGYRWRATDLLVTNFHLPRSTLFMLVCALVGMERAHAAYRHAIATGYRFYSYGDACLLERS
jgi:S-adenosylmethionine:tRNA ribosyltransferase-isomerase